MERTTSLAAIIIGELFLAALLSNVYATDLTPATCVNLRLMMTCNQTFTTTIQLFLGSKQTPDLLLAELFVDSGVLLEYNYMWISCFGPKLLRFIRNPVHFYLYLLKQTCVPTKLQWKYHIWNHRKFTNRIYRKRWNFINKN